METVIQNQTMEVTETETEDVLVSIGDVSKIIGVPTHTIRYWEKEFSNYLEPPRTSGRQRRYGTDQISKLKNIVTMLKRDGYSIAGARRALAMQNQQSNLNAPESPDGIDPATAEKIISMLKQHLVKS